MAMIPGKVVMAIFIFLAVPGFAQVQTADSLTKKAAIAYNDSIIDLVNAVIYADTIFSDTLAENSNIRLRHEKLLQAIGRSRKQLKNIKGFRGDYTFIETARDYLALYEEVVSKEYRKLIKIWVKDPEKMTEKDDKKWEEVGNYVDNRLQNASNEFDLVQKAFAKKFGYEIEE
jgi:hypothetical protein